jgi:hypothetical protein
MSFTSNNFIVSLNTTEILVTNSVYVNVSSSYFETNNTPILSSENTATLVANLIV